jgi:hypothetical protein
MDVLFCNNCFAQYDNNVHVPKILPCLGLKCLKCLKNDVDIKLEDKYIINCKTCHKAHLVSSVIDLPTSEVIIHLIKRQNKPEQVIKHELNSKSIGINEESFSEEFKQKIRIEYYGIYKHYDNIIGDIDIRAESLIHFINKSRQEIQNKVEIYRDESLKVLTEEKYEPSVKEREISCTITNEMKVIKEKLCKLDEAFIKKPKEFELVLKESIKFQQFMHDLKANLWYFSENSMKLESPLLGIIINGTIDRSFLKIRNLTHVLSKSSNLNKVSLSSDIPQNLILRQKIHTIGQIVKIYFCTDNSLHFETFDRQGNLTKKIKAFEGKFIFLSVPWPL